jgi:hypothetical protein
VRQVFALLALRASLDVFFHPGAHARPPELSGNCRGCLVAPWMSGGQCVMQVSQDGASEVVIGWNCAFSVFRPELGVQMVGHFMVEDYSVLLCP